MAYSSQMHQNYPFILLKFNFNQTKKFYSRLFTEIFNYLDKTELTNTWRSVVIFPNRSLDTGDTERYAELLNSPRVTRVYLERINFNWDIINRD